MSRNAVLASVVAAHRPTEKAVAQRCRLYRAAIDGSVLERQDEYIEAITTLHRDAMTRWDWPQIAAAAPPPPRHDREAAARQGAAATPPPPMHDREAAARRALDAYRPTVLEGLFGKAQARRAELEAAVLQARTADDAAWRAEAEARRAQLEAEVLRARADDEAAWRVVAEHWGWLQKVARGVIGGDPDAYQAAIEHLGPFEELEALGETVAVSFLDRSFVEARLTVRHNAVPYAEHNVLASGRTSVKHMPRTRRAELVQAHICSAAIRVARELFALLPISRALVHVGEVLVDPATGHDEPFTLLSVDFDRDRLLNSNFDRIDPASAVESFRHAMKFKKSDGLLPIAELEPLAQLTSLDSD